MLPNIEDKPQTWNPPPNYATSQEDTILFEILVTSLTKLHNLLMGIRNVFI